MLRSFVVLLGVALLVRGDASADVAKRRHVDKPAASCVRVGALRCHGTRIEMCFSNDDEKPTWVPLETCVRPKVCVEDGPQCDLPGWKARLARGAKRAATVVVLVVIGVACRSRGLHQCVGI